MIKITLQVDTTRATIYEKDGSDLGEVLQVVNQAILGCGFYPKGSLDYVEDEACIG